MSEPPGGEVIIFRDRDGLSEDRKSRAEKSQLGKSHESSC